MSIPSNKPAAQAAPHQPPDAPSPSGVRDTALRVVVSLDVEEEGLFSGAYAATGCTVRNVPLLRRLAPLSTELGFPLTLLCAHTVFADAEARATLEYMRDHAGAEIGAHLHHWSTPPLEDSAKAAHGGTATVYAAAASARAEASKSFGTCASAGGRAPVRTHLLPRELLRSRLRSLLAAGRDFQGAPLTSFRMGRWDLKASVRPLLAEEGILVDSSVCPLRVFFGGRPGEPDGPDHFLAPADPYWPRMPDGRTPLLESPITQLPLHPALARAWRGLLRGRRAVDSFRGFAAFSPNPVWHGAAVMRMATRLHVARGGRVLHLFWHSSEMLPGASPHIPHQDAADALIRKVRDFLAWLRAHYAVRGVTLSSLHAEPDFPVVDMPAEGDW